MSTRDQLLRRYAELGNQSPATSSPKVPAAELVAGPTPVHRAAVELLDELLSLVPHDAPPFSGIIRTLKRLEPMLLRDFAKVPPENVASFLNELGVRMQRAASEHEADVVEPESLSDGGSETIEEARAVGGP